METYNYLKLVRHVQRNWSATTQPMLHVPNSIRYQTTDDARCVYSKIYPAQEFPNTELARTCAVVDMDYTRELLDLHDDESEPLINDPTKINPFTGETSKPSASYTHNPLSIDMPLPPAPRFTNSDFATRGRKLYRSSKLNI